MSTSPPHGEADPSRAQVGLRRRARLAGLLYLITFLTSIPTLALYAPLREHRDFVLGVGSAGGVHVGLLLEIALAASCAATAVALFPVLRPRSESMAFGFLAARVVEAALILVGVISLLAILRVRNDVVGTPAGAEAPPLQTAQDTLLAVYDGTFLLGQSLMPVVSALCLGSVLYRFHLVPRLIPALGLAGAPLLLASDVAVLLGVYPQSSAPAGLAALPVALWELALGLWLTGKGFRTVASPHAPHAPHATPRTDEMQGEPGREPTNREVQEPESSAHVPAPL